MDGPDQKSPTCSAENRREPAFSTAPSVGVNPLAPKSVRPTIFYLIEKLGAPDRIRTCDLCFGGKGSIHPKQIAILNDVFTPDQSTIAHGRRIIRGFAEADTGLVVIDGKRIEKPVLREMRRIVAIAERLAA